MDDAYPILIAVGVGSVIMLAGAAGGVFLAITVVKNAHPIQRGGDVDALPGGAATEASMVHHQSPLPSPPRKAAPLKRERPGTLMEAASRNSTNRVHALIGHKKKIAELRIALRIRSTQTLTRWVSGTLAVVLLFSFIIANVAVGWSTITLANKIAIPVFVLSAGTCGAIYLMERKAKEDPDSHYGKAARDLKIELEAAEELRLLDAAQLGLPVQDRQYSYKDSIPAEMDSLRKDGRKYRRRHNSAQSVIILGSLGGGHLSPRLPTRQPPSSTGPWESA